MGFSVIVRLSESLDNRDLHMSGLAEWLAEFIFRIIFEQFTCSYYVTAHRDADE